MLKNSQRYIELLLQWRSPYAPDTDIVEYVDEEVGKLQRKLKRNPHFSNSYASNSGELPATMLEKADAIQGLLHRWRKADENGTLAQQPLTHKELSITSDCLQFIMLPFTRFSHSAMDIIEKWGPLGAALTGRDVSEAESLANKADGMTKEHKELCNILQNICQSAGYQTGVRFPQAYKLDTQWMR